MRQLHRDVNTLDIAKVQGTWTSHGLPQRAGLGSSAPTTGFAVTLLPSDWRLYAWKFLVGKLLRC